MNLGIILRGLFLEGGIDATRVRTLGDSFSWRLPRRPSWERRITAGAWEREPLSAFHERRARLIRDTGGDGVVVLYGYGEADVAASVTSFRQNEEFYYLTGWNEPEAIMLLAPKAHAPGARRNWAKRSSTFPRTTARRRNGRDPSWRPEDADAPARTGFPDGSRRRAIRRRPAGSAQGFPKIYTELTPATGERRGLLSGGEVNEASRARRPRLRSPTCA